VNIPKSGTAIGNTTYDQVTVGPIDETVFAHPTVNLDFPEMGKCKEFGKDPMCMQMGAAHEMLAEHKAYLSAWA
jgi:hypothetical protein